MEEETDNTNVEEMSQDIDNESVSSTDEQDLEDLSQDELIALVQQKEEARKKAVGHLREQQKKRAESPKAQESTTETPAAIPDLDKLIEQKVQEVTKQTTIKQFAKGSDDWLYDQSWGKEFSPEEEGSEKLYAKLAVERDRLLKERDVRSEEDYRKVIALAAVNVTGKPDALLSVQAPNHEADYQKRIASTGGGSSNNSSQSNTATYTGLNDMERTMINRANELRAKQGLPPLKQEEIFKK